MKNPLKTMDVSLPHEVAADLTIAASRIGVETARYLGTMVIAGAYGQQHPSVKELRKRAINSISGTETGVQKKSTPMNFLCKRCKQPQYSLAGRKKAIGGGWYCAQCKHEIQK